MRAADLAMAFNLLTQTDERWRRIDSLHLDALVADRVKFRDDEMRTLLGLPSDAVVNPHVDDALQTVIHNI